MVIILILKILATAYIAGEWCIVFHRGMHKHISQIWEFALVTIVALPLFWIPWHIATDF